MSVDSSDASRAKAADAAPLLARAAGADRRAEARLATAIDDFFLAEDDRLDDRTRAGMTALIAATIEAIGGEVAGNAARTLARPDAFATARGALMPRLIDSGLLRDNELMAELIGQVRQDQLSLALVANRAPDTAPTLLARLTACEDGVVAAAAAAFLMATSRRAAAHQAARPELPAALHHRVVWWAAAALRDRRQADSEAQIAVDRALAAAALRSITAHDDADRLEAAATRLAAAIDARRDELPDLLIDTLAEGRTALFVAVLAHAGRIDFAEARELVLDPDGDRLWLALRAHGLARETIARIGLALADADHRRDIDALADELDTIADIAPEAARATLAPLALHRDFRKAVRALSRSAR